MARTTDRQHIAEALRLANKSRKRWVCKAYTEGRYDLDVFDDTGHELNITYSPAGRITKLVHWVPATREMSSRTPIYHNKRERALEVING